MKFIVTIFLSIILVIAGGACCQAEEIARMIAKVNKQVITSKDLEYFCKVLSYKFSNDREDLQSGSDEFRREALSRMIEDMLILEKAKEEKIVIPNSWLDDKVKQMVLSYPTREQFEASLTERGLTVTLIKEKIKEQYLMREIINKNVRALISVSPQKISRYYAEHKNEFNSPQIYHFYIAKSEDEGFLKKIAKLIDESGVKEATAMLDKNILVEVESGKDELREDIAKILEKAKKGKWIIEEIEGGKCLVYLNDIILPRRNSLEEVKERIYSYLWQREFQKKFNEWVGELKKNALIKIYHE